MISETVKNAIEEEKRLAVAEKTAMSVVNEQTQKLLETPEVKKQAEITAAYDIRADLAKKGAEIHKKNIETAETQFETETRELRLKQLKSELTLDHKYKMSILAENGRHKQMLDRRKKLEERYGYLYERTETGELIDFSYSETVNKIRTFTRNVSRLDTTVKKLLKWVFIIGIGTAALTLLKKYNLI